MLVFCRGLAGELKEPFGHLWPLAFVLVLEENESILPSRLADAIEPRFQFRIAVIGTPQAQVAPIRSGHERSVNAIVTFSDAQ